MPTAIKHYEVRWRPTDDVDLWSYFTVPAGSTAIDIEDAERGVDYTIEVRSVGINGLTSEWISTTHTVNTGETFIPVVPLLLTVKPVVDGIGLSWTITGTAVVGTDYEIWRAPAVGPSASVGTWGLLTVVKATSYVDNITDGNRYWYRVRAALPFSDSPYCSAEISASKPHGQIPYNGSFENWMFAFNQYMPDHWELVEGVYGADVIGTQEVSKDGRHSMQFQQTNVETKIASNAHFPVIGGADYSFSAHIYRITAAALGTVELVVEWYSTTQVLISASTIVVSLPALTMLTWTVSSSAIASPPTATWAKVTIGKGAPEAFGFIIDAVRLMETAVAGTAAIYTSETFTMGADVGPSISPFPRTLTPGFTPRFVFPAQVTATDGTISVSGGWPTWTFSAGTLTIHYLPGLEADKEYTVVWRLDP